MRDTPVRQLKQAYFSGVRLARSLHASCSSDPADFREVTVGAPVVNLQLSAALDGTGDCIAADQLCATAGPDVQCSGDHTLASATLQLGTQLADTSPPRLDVPSTVATSDSHIEPAARRRGLVFTCTSETVELSRDDGMDEDNEPVPLLGM